jgi:hypothetical protein
VTLPRPRPSFGKAIKGQGSGPRTVTLDGYAASHRAVREMKSDGELPADPRLRSRSSKYWNNLIEQGHRGVKLRIGPMLGFKRFNRGDHHSGDRTATADPQGAVRPPSAASSGSTCACCLGCSLGSPIKRQHREVLSHSFWLSMLFAPEPSGRSSRNSTRRQSWVEHPDRQIHRSANDYSGSDSRRPCLRDEKAA